MVISAPSGASLPTPKLDKTTKIHEAATQFEAILIGQMLKSAHAAGGGGWMGSEDDQNSTLGDFGEQQFAQALAKQGGFGLAKMVVAGLEKNENR
jgi:Rod binding domain-containing protein